MASDSGHEKKVNNFVMLFARTLFFLNGTGNIPVRRTTERIAVRFHGVAQNILNLRLKIT